MGFYQLDAFEFPLSAFQWNRKLNSRISLQRPLQARQHLKGKAGENPWKRASNWLCGPWLWCWYTNSIVEPSDMQKEHSIFCFLHAYQVGSMFFDRGQCCSITSAKKLKGGPFVAPSLTKRQFMEANHFKHAFQHSSFLVLAEQFRFQWQPTYMSAMISCYLLKWKDRTSAASPLLHAHLL